MVDLSVETFRPFSSIEVEGTPLSQQQQSQVPHPSSITLKATSHSTSGPSYSGFQSVVHQNRKNGGGFSLKVVQAKITHITGKGRPNFEIQGQSFIEVNEKSANVGYIRTKVQQEFGPEYTVVTADGLEVKDSTGTQGMIMQASVLVVVIAKKLNVITFTFICRDEVLESEFKEVLCCTRGGSPSTMSQEV